MRLLFQTMILFGLNGLLHLMGGGNSTQMGHVLEIRVKWQQQAIALGIRLAKNLSCDKLIIESDSAVAIKLLTDDFDYKSQL
ncbi:uncharacterized protein G2W53_009054 [Senna tora]|uniref:RNase H type-1 domain-containing protein n=1 Tax=Senna tora TaxID=362788 RepID=A0A835C9F8_9FABA|nr:uncharacterized protein G2W53_009054 [Senna tora]